MKNAPQTPKKDILRTFVSWGFTLFVIIVVASIIWQTIQFYQTTHTLKSLHPRSIRELRIYPRTTFASGAPITFSPADTFIDEFLNALADIRAYRGSSKGVMSLEHVWFVEIETTEGLIIQMRCHLPASRKQVVHGEIGKFYEKGGGPHYGKFRSQGLFHWYQQYSYRWLGEKGKDEGFSLESSQ